jgi:hypothetical protein
MTMNYKMWEYSAHKNMEEGLYLACPPRFSQGVQCLAVGSGDCGGMDVLLHKKEI